MKFGAFHWIIIFSLLLMSDCSEVRAQKNQVDPDAEPTLLDDPVEKLDPVTDRSNELESKIESRALFSAARVHERREEYAKALKLYQKAFVSQPDSVEIVNRIIPMALRLKRTELAMRFAIKAIQHNPENELLIRQVGAHLIDQGRLDAALEIFEQGLSTGKMKKNTQAYIALRAQMGDLYFINKKYDKAADCFSDVMDAINHPEKYGLTKRIQKLLIDNPARTWERFGISFLKAKQPKKAIEAFQRSDKATPNKGRLAFREAQVFHAENEPGKALAALEDFFAHQASDLGNEEPYELLRDLYQELKREDELISKLQRLAALQSENVSLNHFLAKELIKAKDLKKAKPILERLAKSAKDIEILKNLSDIYLELKQPKEFFNILVKTAGEKLVTDHFNEILNHWRDEDDKIAKEKLAFLKEASKSGHSGAKELKGKERFNALVIAGVLSLETLEFDQANKAFAEAEKIDEGDKLRVYQLWGLGLLFEQKYDASAEVLQKIIDQKLQQPADPLYHYHISGALEMAGKTDEAIKFAKEAVSIRPDLPLLHQRVAWVYYHAHRMDEAIEEYTKVIEMFEGQEAAKEARSVLSAIMVTQKNFPRAEELLEEVLEEYPDDPSASNDLGYLWADQGKHLERSLEMIQLALDDQPENKAYLDSLGWVYYKLGRYKDAIAPLEKAVDQEDPDGVILEHLADAYFKVKRKKDAIKFWERALKSLVKAQFPDTEAIQRVKDKLQKNK